MLALRSLASRLSEATDTTSAAELLAEHLLGLLPDAAARIYLLGPGDRCGTCNRARDCASRDRCFHLQTGVGEFTRPPGYVERIPQTDATWAATLAGNGPITPAAPPSELEVPAEAGSGRPTLLLPLIAAGEVVGAAGIRCDVLPDEQTASAVGAAMYLGATTFRVLSSLQTEGQRFKQILLVNELGRKVNSILNDDLLLRQAVVDIQRTFGFHNVMIFMRSGGTDRLVMRAQASQHVNPSRGETAVEVGQGIVGRACRRGRTELIQDVKEDPDFIDWFSDTKSEVAVPIQIGGVVEGVLNVENDRVHGFSESDRLVLETVAYQLAIAIENARLFGMVKEREDRYRVLVESNPGAVFHLDNAGRIIFTNPAATELTGFEKSDLVARAGGLADLAVEADRSVLDAAVSEALRGVEQHDLEFRVRHHDGSPRSVRVALQPLVGEDGDARGVVVLARDQTRENELQDQLRQSEKLSAIGSLVSGVAHELNNPLAGILGFAQLLLGRPTEEWKRQDVEKIEKNARRCQHIVENLLAFARQARMRKRLANINEVIDSVIRLNEYQFRMDNVEIQRDLDLRAPLLPLDVHRWQQVFINLAANAHQALVSSKEGERIIRFETRRRDAEMLIRVSDNGPGIPEEVKARIFEPFFTTKDAGTGLGLGICFGIVSEHGGTIDIDPSHRDGTCFRITMPIPAEAVEPEHVPAKKAKSHSEAGVSRRALVVDDEEYVCEVVGGALANHDYVVDTAPDAKAAIESIERNIYDVILSDVYMPGEMNGLELHDHLRQERPELAQRMIFLTGNILNESLMDSIAERGVRCIEKPFDIHQLAVTVNEVAGQGRVE
ncbi:MAG: hybrid sensor histidine kinase/response regulator [Planctomycetota bacterium]|jgi:two-component system NtrC family sensor kinase